MAAAASTPSSPVIVRRAREQDVDRLLEIHLAAFPDPRPLEVRRRVFLHNRLGDLEHLRVAEAGSTLLGHAFSFPIASWFGGRRVAGSAVASVGVAPEARGHGVARALFATMHAETKARGGSFSLLYAFRQGFYARLGYAPLGRYRALEVSPRAIPRDWRDAALGVIRPLRGEDAPGLVRVYAEAARRGSGALDRPDRAWKLDLLDERRQWLVLERDGAIAGYVAFRLHQSQPHARIRAEVYELVAPDDAVRRRLFATLGALGDQVSDLSLALADDDPIDWAFVDADRDRGGTEEVEHPLGVVAAGPMLHLVSPGAALAARGYATDGTTFLAIDGDAPLRLEVRHGEASVSAAPDADALRLGGKALASVAFGGLALDAAVRLGWVDAPDPALLHAAAELLRVPAFFSVDGF